MITFPNAKINIGLHVIGKREDGYHNLETIFYPVRLYDALELVPSTSLELSVSGISVPVAGNLCIQAFEVLAVDYDLEPVHFFLHKNIPVGAGLGGGSADGAFALKLLNDYFQLNLSTEKLEQYAAQLGSDCSFFIRNQPAFAQGRGDELFPIALDLSAYTILLVCPPVFVSTAEAFKNLQPVYREVDMPALMQRPIQEWKTYLKNDFEPTLFKRYPELKGIKDTLYQKGALYASMSGSGSTVFGIFEKDAVLPRFSDSVMSCEFLVPSI